MLLNPAENPVFTHSKVKHEDERRPIIKSSFNCQAIQNVEKVDQNLTCFFIEFKF